MNKKDLILKKKGQKVHFLREIRWPGEISAAISGRVGIYEKGIKKTECILWDMDSGIIFVQKLGLCKAANGVYGI